MSMTLKLKQDVLDLLDAAKKIYAERGETLADSKAAKMCFGHTDYVSSLRKWDGGKGGPTLEKTYVFEQFLRQTIGEKEYGKFLKSRKRPTVQPEDVDDFGD